MAGETEKVATADETLGAQGHQADIPILFDNQGWIEANSCTICVPKIKRTSTVKVLILLGINGVPRGIRTPVIAVKGRCPGPG